MRGEERLAPLSAAEAAAAKEKPPGERMEGFFAEVGPGLELEEEDKED